MMLSMVFVMIAMSAASAKRIVEVLDEHSATCARQNSRSAGGRRHHPVRPRYFQYNTAAEKPVLDDMSLTSSGETVGIIGGTGAAKRRSCS